MADLRTRRVWRLARRVLTDCRRHVDEEVEPALAIIARPEIFAQMAVVRSELGRSLQYSEFMNVFNFSSANLEGRFDAWRAHFAIVVLVLACNAKVEEEDLCVRDA